MATVTIRLDQDCRTEIMRVDADSELTCVKTSAPGVYTCGILQDKQQELRPDQSMAIKGGSKLTIRLFQTRHAKKEAPFSAELLLAPKGS